MSELRYLDSKTILKDCPFARKITGFINELPFGCFSLFTGKIISYCSNITSILLTLSCKWIGTLLARCFLKIASSFRGKCSGEFTFQH